MYIKKNAVSADCFSLNFSQVKVRTGLSSSKIRSLTKSGNFPHQYSRDDGEGVFLRHEIDEWIEKQIAVDLAKVQTRAYIQLLAKSLHERGRHVSYLVGHLCLKKHIFHASGALHTLTRAEVSHEFERLLTTVQRAVLSEKGSTSLQNSLCFPVVKESWRGGWIVNFILECPSGINEHEFLCLFLDAWFSHDWFTESWSAEPLSGPEEVLDWVRARMKDVSINDNTVDFSNMNLSF